jgi:prepilin-type N-terminal cleavage/methylation domain-containing protein
MKSSKGFSLIEVMIAVAMIGILSAIAVSSIIRQRNNANLRDAVSTIRGDFEMARSRAIRDNAFVPVILDTDGYTIFIDNGGSGGGIADNWVQDGDEKILCSRKLPAGIQIDLTQTTFTDFRTRFNGRGYSSNNGILTLLGAGKSATVDMNNRFGRITTAY